MSNFTLQVTKLDFRILKENLFFFLSSVPSISTMLLSTWSLSTILSACISSLLVLFSVFFSLSQSNFSFSHLRNTRCNCFHPHLSLCNNEVNSAENTSLLSNLYGVWHPLSTSDQKKASEFCPRENWSRLFYIALIFITLNLTSRVYVKKNQIHLAHFSEVRLGEKWMLNPNTFSPLLLNFTIYVEWKMSKTRCYYVKIISNIFFSLNIGGRLASIKQQWDGKSVACAHL